MKIIFINGPKGSGKDVAGRYLIHSLMSEGTIFKFAETLKDTVHAAFGIEGPHDVLELVKDQVHPEMGMTPRKAYISVSEDWMKPTFGIDIYGRILVKKIDTAARKAMATRSNRMNNVVITDSGFEPEALAVIERYASAKFMLIRLHRPGHDFSGDSRGYIELPVPTYDIMNDGTISELKMKMEYLAHDIMYQDFNIWPPRTSQV